MSVSLNSYHAYAALPPLSLANQQLKEKNLIHSEKTFSSLEYREKDRSETKLKCLALAPLRLISPPLENSSCLQKTQIVSTTRLWLPEGELTQADIENLASHVYPLKPLIKPKTTSKTNFSKDFKELRLSREKFKTLLNLSNEEGTKTSVSIGDAQPIRNVDLIHPLPEVPPANNANPLAPIPETKRNIEFPDFAPKIPISASHSSDPMQNPYYREKFNIIQRISSHFLSEDLRNIPNVSNQNCAQTNDVPVPPVEAQGTANSVEAQDTANPVEAQASANNDSPAPTPNNPTVPTPEPQPIRNINLVAPPPVIIDPPQNLNIAQGIQNNSQRNLNIVQKISEYAKKWWYFFAQKALSLMNSMNEFRKKIKLSDIKALNIKSTLTRISEFYKKIKSPKLIDSTFSLFNFKNLFDFSQEHHHHHHHHHYSDGQAANRSEERTRQQSAQSASPAA